MITLFTSIGRTPKVKAADVALPRMIYLLPANTGFLFLDSRLHGCKLIPDQNRIAAVNAALCSRKKAYSAELSGHVRENGHVKSVI